MSGTEIEQASQYADTPSGWAQRWAVELAAARTALERWHNSGERIVKRYLDERDSEREEGETRWNLFTANVQTQESMMYGRVPQVSVARRFNDAQDDVARVAGEMLERLLNSDVERKGDTYAEALGYALQDRLLPGFGLVRIRYEADFEEDESAESVPDEETGELTRPERKSYECVETDYVHWKDALWSPGRVWHEVRWVAFRADMSREQVAARFDTAALESKRGGTVADAIPYKAGAGKDKDGEKRPDPWKRAEVWEVWDRESRRVFWYVEGYGECLDIKEDPLGLESFFPCPRPMLANVVTGKVVPRPDFVLAQDQYNQIDTLSTRIKLLVDACKVRGVYDKSNPELKRLLSEGGGNELIPVENWALFAERGGIRGAVDWFPLEQVAQTIAILRQEREALKADLYEATGMSDLMRGQAAAANTSATEQSIKARFASVRMQRLQDDFARFASEVQALKAEVIAKHFDDATIIGASNIELTPDVQFAPQAVALLRDRLAHYRVQVKPESVSLQDFAALRSEGLEVIGALTQFVTAMAPLAQQMPQATPHLLRMLQWGLSRFKGAAEIEGVLDTAIAQAQQAAAQPPPPAPPDPKVQAQQLKGQQEKEKRQDELQGKLVLLQAETQAKAIEEQNQREENVKEAAQKAMVAQQFRPAPGPGPSGGKQV